ncbi:hypothetical protein ASPFODRAFT_37224 [Aspergillus luchuensis CBS 106.47]|uniref:Uncharacterized protein n=1 Tax=Aspergillus luchuensis (strain CBS 106.47) TaxID=1137211 RepID=A0A1M3T5R9_ASPLC|nr:hypothetical protein ASPFODRAFT_37224 [Aspergillus luchuensis CBS 106.47]
MSTNSLQRTVIQSKYETRSLPNQEPETLKSDTRLIYPPNSRAIPAASNTFEQGSRSIMKSEVTANSYHSQPYLVVGITPAQSYQTASGEHYTSASGANHSFSCTSSSEQLIPQTYISHEPIPGGVTRSVEGQSHLSDKHSKESSRDEEKTESQAKNGSDMTPTPDAERTYSASVSKSHSPLPAAIPCMSCPSDTASARPSYLDGDQQQPGRLTSPETTSLYLPGVYTTGVAVIQGSVHLDNDADKEGAICPPVDLIGLMSCQLRLTPEKSIKSSIDLTSVLYYTEGDRPGTFNPSQIEHAMVPFVTGVRMPNSYILTGTLHWTTPVRGGIMMSLSVDNVENPQKHSPNAPYVQKVTKTDLSEAHGPSLEPSTVSGCITKHTNISILKNDDYDRPSTSKCTLVSMRSPAVALSYLDHQSSLTTMSHDYTTYSTDDVTEHGAATKGPLVSVSGVDNAAASYTPSKRSIIISVGVVSTSACLFLLIFKWAKRRNLKRGVMLNKHSAVQKPQPRDPNRSYFSIDSLS